MQLAGHAVPETQPPAEDTVRRVHGLAVHERAAAHDWLDPVLPTGLQCLGRHAARPERPMEPDAANAVGRRLAHEAGPDGRRRGDDQPVDRPWNGRQIGVRSRPFELRGVRVHGDGLIPALLKPAEDGVGGRATRARDTSNNDAFTGEKIGDG